MLRINDKVTIPLRELHFSFARSSGPGGQNVNKVNTRVTLWFDLQHSPSLNAEDKALIASRLETRINRLGELRVISLRHRTQGQNKEAAIARFVELLAEALHRARSRKKSKPTAASRHRRLEAKKQHSRLKRERQRKEPHDS